MTHEELVATMLSLKEHRGWKIIQEHLKPVIDQAELKLLGDDSLSPDEQKDLKKDWKLHKKFYEYPDFLVAKSAAQAGTGKDTLDPY